MAVLTMFRIKGDPDDLLRTKQEKLDPKIGPIAKENGQIEHFVCREDDGLLVVNLWEDLEGNERTAEQAQQVIGEAGLDRRPEGWQHWEVVQREVR